LPLLAYQRSLPFWLPRQLGLVDIESARQFKAPLNLVGLFFGTLLFGIGMGLSRGCVSRLIILSGSRQYPRLDHVGVFIAFRMVGNKRRFGRAADHPRQPWAD
jgi:uncharacterized membrane protein YedE/YeeE